MIGLSLALAVAVHSNGADSALELCKPVLARKAGGEIATIDVDSNRLHRGTRTIRGEMTIFVRMGPAAPGSARANHVGRFDYSFRCQTRHGRVASAAVKLRQ